MIVMRTYEVCMVNADGTLKCVELKVPVEITVCECVDVPVTGIQIRL